VKHPEAALRAYRDLLVAEPVSVTSVRDPEAAWDLHVADALTALDLVLRLDLARPAATDQLADTINYASLFELTREIVEGSPFRLIERARIRDLAEPPVVRAAGPEAGVRRLVHQMEEGATSVGRHGGHEADGFLDPLGPVRGVIHDGERHRRT